MTDIEKNCKYQSKGEYAFESSPCPLTELEEARKQAKQIKPEKYAMRSCWICNEAHYHFLNGDWGEWVLCCFECGRYFYNKIDITCYDD